MSKKKLMGLLLAIMMVFSLCANSFTAYAWNLSDIEEMPMEDPNAIADEPDVDEPEPVVEDDYLIEEADEPEMTIEEDDQREDLEDGLEISDEYVPPMVSSTEPVTISSFEDLKDALNKVDVQKYLRADNGKHLVLKNNNYKLESDITIDLADAYFSDKYEYIQTGIMSFGNSINDQNQTADDSEFIFDGNGHTITINPEQGKEALPLFGTIISGKTQIKNLNLVIDGDVIGYPFADLISSMQSKDAQGYTIANGLVENINVSVNGSVVPQVLPWNEDSKRWSILGNYHFAGNFTGSMATGFGVKVNRTNLNNIKVNISGDIGSASVQKLDDNYKQKIAQGENYSAGAFGFLWCSDDADYHRDETGDSVWTKTRTELFKNGNYKVLRECGYIENVDIKIGGSIYATGYDNAYASGFMDSSDNSWVDNINVNIGGDIKTVLLGGNEASNPFYGNDSMSASYAVGFAESLTNFTNSKLSVNNLIMEVSDDYQKQVNGKKQNLVTSLCGIGYDSGSGNLIRVINNTVNIRGKMEAKTSINLIANAGFYNTWNSNSKDGVNWAHFFENNNITVGEIDLKQTSDYALQYYGFGEKFRTGTLSDWEVKEGYKPLEEVSAKENTLNVGKLTLTNQGGYSKVYPSFYNATNAKNNEITYGDITVVSREGVFSGFGNLINDEPIDNNGVKEITENNKLDLGDITIAGINFQTISLGANTIDSDKKMRNNEIKAGDVIVKLGGFSNQGQLTAQNSKTLYFSGLSFFNKGLIHDNHIFVKDIDVLNTSTTYFGLGAAFNKGEMKDSTVLVDKDVIIESIGTLYEGLFVAYSNRGKFDDCHAQINGVTSLGVLQGVGRYFGSFGGWLSNTEVKNSSALMFNGYSPFAYYMDGGSLDGVANYSDEGNWKFMSGLLATSNQNNKPTIKNSTYIVNKAFEYTDDEGSKHKQNNEDSIVYRDDNVSSDSTNNYIVIVGEESEDEFNRIAYKLEKRKASADEMGPSTPDVWAKGKDAKAVGKINIAKRTFQDKYWGDNASEYKTGKDEKEFYYMNENPDNLKIIPYGRFTDIVESDGAISDKASLENYYDRHVGLRVADGPIYDLLGIKGYPIVEEPEPTPPPAPKPTEPSTVILTLDENYRNGKITNIEVEVGDLIEPHLYIPRRRGYIFRGWSYDQKHLDEVKPGDRIYSDTTLYAIWKRAEEEKVEEPEEIKGDDHKAYIFGYPNGTVRPNGSITRAEAAAMLARLLNIEAIGSAAKPNFADTESSWYNKAINAVVFRGIMKGYPDGRFRPNAPITRAEFTQMISTIDNKPYGVAPFADVPGHWAERAIGSEYQAKRITGYPDGLFRPDANITRAEAAVILNKIFERKYDNLSLLKCKNPQMIKRFTDLDETFWGWNDMVEATNTHEYVRREKNKLPEDWLLIK